MIKVKMSDFVRVEMPDNDPDLSWLGEYTDKPKDATHTTEQTS